MKRASFLLLLGVFVLILTGGYSGYVYWQKSVTDTDLKKVNKSVMDYQNQILQKENEKITKAINAKETLNDLKANSIKWSEAIKKIRATIPKEDNVPLIQILSYSGSSASDISLNVKTLPDREEPYSDIADLIKNFDESAIFADTFVPSISAGTNEKGKEILTFLLSAKYLQEKESDKLEDALSDILNEPITR